MLIRGFLSAALVTCLGACAGSGPLPGDTSAPRFDPGQLAKTDIDRVTEAHQREIASSLRLLAQKLYSRNPRSWRQAGQPSAEAAVARIFDARAGWRFPELGEARGVEAVHLAFRDDFEGDRVLAFVGGLGGMIAAAFDGKTEFFMLDDLEPQRFYNCARNLEIAAWKLNNARNIDNGLFLLSNHGAYPLNLSFEREFGRMIGNLDLLAKVVADRSQRVLARVVQNLATAVFLPVH